MTISTNAEGHFTISIWREVEQRFTFFLRATAAGNLAAFGFDFKMQTILTAAIFHRVDVLAINKLSHALLLL